jgi:hypothetical protein
VLISPAQYLMMDVVWAMCSATYRASFPCKL